MVFVVAFDQSDQRASPGCLGNDVRRMVDAAFEGLRFDVEPEAGFLFVRPVTGMTVLLKDRPHVTHKINRTGLE